MTDQSVMSLVTTVSRPKNKSFKERQESRRAELLAAALELFVARGFAATRLEDVAARAGVGKGTLYLYFAGKEELFKAVVRGGILPAIKRAEALIEGFTGSADELLRDVVSGMWSQVGGTLLSGVPKLVIAESGNFPDLARFYYQEVIVRGLGVMASILERGIQQGRFRRLDVDPTARALMGPLLLMMLWRHSFESLEGTPLDAQRYLESYLALVLDGLHASTLVEARG